MTSTTATDATRQPRVDWDSTVKLAVVVSLLAALAAITLAGRVAGPWLILAVVLVGSTLSWRHAGRRMSAG